MWWWSRDRSSRGRSSRAAQRMQCMGGRQKLQAQMEEEAMQRWWQEEQHQVWWARQAVGEATRRAKEVELGAQQQEGVGMLLLPRAEVGAVKAKAQVKGQGVARQEAELKVHEAAEAQ